MAASTLDWSDFIQRPGGSFHDHKHPPKADLTDMVCDRQLFSKAGESHLAITIGGRRADFWLMLSAGVRQLCTAGFEDFLAGLQIQKS